MNIDKIARQIHKYVDDNAPLILTGMAVAGATVTAVFAAQGAHKAHERILEAKFAKLDEQGLSSVIDYDKVEIDSKDKFLLTYQFYVPAVVTLTGTATCMVLATKIGLNRTAAAAAALAVSERTYDQYKDKVKETLGENKHVKVTDELAKEQVAAMPSEMFVINNEGEQVFIDAWSGRAISTTREKIEKAVNDFNKEMIYGGYASLSEFYRRLGLDETTESNDIGWNSENLLELYYTAVLKDDKAVQVFTFDRKPMSTFCDASI